MKTPARALALAAVLTMHGFSAAAQSPEQAAAALRARSCQGCHGEKGDSTDPSVPRLNGQQLRYLQLRLDSFRYPLRESPRAIHAMGDMAPELSRQVIGPLARFYAGQQPPALLPPAKSQEAGMRIYQKGEKQLPACASCHGAAGEGGGTTPRLAGQHARYLTLQLQSFAIAGRIAPPMNYHLWFVSPEQISALVAYLAGPSAAAKTPAPRP